MAIILQDLERVRNLAYMVSRREKLSRSFVKLREQILERQMALLADEEPANQMSLLEMSAIIEANHGPTIYDRAYSQPECEQHSYEDFEVIVSRIAGEITERSDRIRKDNPLRTKSTESTGSVGKPELKYERIFSDTSQSESDDSFIQNVKPLNSRRSSLSKKSHKDIKKKPLDKKSKKSSISPSKPPTRSDTSMSSSEEEAELKALTPRKELNKSSSKNKSIYSESDSDHEPRVKGRGASSKSKKTKEVKSERKKTEMLGESLDSEDTQTSLDRPRSPVFRTKAAMKEFSLPELSRAKEISRSGVKPSPEPLPPKKSSKSKLKEQPDSSLSELEMMDVDDLKPPIILVPERSAARKANQKLNKKPEPGEDKKKVRGVKTSDLFGDSDSESELPQPVSPSKSRDLRKSPRVKHGANTSHNSDLSETESLPRKSLFKIEEFKSNVNQKSKTKSSLHQSSLNLSDSEEDIFTFPRDKESKTSKLTKSKKTAATALADESEFDSLFDNDIRPPSLHESEDSDEFHNKKREFDDFENPEMFTIVPQRRAAKKASEQLKETDMWKKTQQEAYLATLAQAQLEKADPSKKRGRPNSKKKKSDSDTEIFQRRTRSSDLSPSSDSNSDSDVGKSPKGGRGKSPKGKKPGKTQSPKPSKPTVKRQRNKKSPRRRPDGSISSSKALEYLTQRESQISNILGSLSKEDKEETDKAGKVSPDKKLKTSEGRPEGDQSPPGSSKTSSDSESDTDTDDSIIQKLKPSTKPASEPHVFPSREPLELPASESEQSLGPPEGKPIGLPIAVPIVESKKADDRLAGGRRGNRSDSSVDRSTERDRASGDEVPPSRTGSIFSPAHRASPAQGQQLKQSIEKPSGAEKKSIFSPERSPRTVVEPITVSQSPAGLRAGEHESTSQKENESPTEWRSPRDRKLPESRSPRVSSSSREKGREILTQTKSPTKSPALNRSLDGSLNRSLDTALNRSLDVPRNSPLPHLLKSPLGQSPSLHGSKDALNKSIDSDKTVVDLGKQALNKSDNEPEEELIIGRKFSIESKDSDADSAKSSLPEANGLLQALSKEDSTDTLEFTDKLSDASLKTDPQKGVQHQAKTDEGYVSAEKPVVVPPSPAFENNLHESNRKKDAFPNLDSMVSNLEKSSAPSLRDTFDFGMKAQDLIPDIAKLHQQLNLQQQFTEHTQSMSTDKPAKVADDLSGYYNPPAGQKQQATESSVSLELQQLLQQQQLQQQMLQGDRGGWPLFNQADTPAKQKTSSVELGALGDLYKVDKKSSELSQQQQALYNEAFLNQMFTLQNKQMSQTQSIAYAQQYMKVNIRHAEKSGMLDYKILARFYFFISFRSDDKVV